MQRHCSCRNTIKMGMKDLDASINQIVGTAEIAKEFKLDLLALLPILLKILM